MNEIIRKLNIIKDKISLEKTEEGVLRLFCLIKRTDVESKWDILISADWVNVNNSKKDLLYIVEKIKDEFDGNINFMSKIFLIKPQEDFINEFAAALKQNKISAGYNGELRVSDELTIEEIYVLAFNFKRFKLKEVEGLKKKTYRISSQTVGF